MYRNPNYILGNNQDNVNVLYIIMMSKCRLLMKISFEVKKSKLHASKCACYPKSHKPFV